MATEADFLLDDNDDLIVKDGDFVVGESLTQEVGIIIRANKGEFKQWPLLGPNLIQMVRKTISQDEINTRVKLQLQYDGKDYEDIKELISVHKNSNE